MNWLSTVIGIVIGVFIASYSPETASSIREYTLEIIQQVQGIIQK